MPSRPVVAPISEEVYEGLTTWARADHDVWDLLIYVDAMMKTLQPIVSLVRDTEQHEGWARLLDVDAAPSEALPWLAQLVGVMPLKGLSDEAQRLRIKEAAGWQRGTPAAMRAAAQQFLTGSRLVEIYERDGSPWRFRIRTYLRETPNARAVYNAVAALKPAGLVFVHEVQAGVSIDSLVGTIDSYSQTIESFSNTLPTDPDIVGTGRPFGSGRFGRGPYSRTDPTRYLSGPAGLVSISAFGTAGTASNNLSGPAGLVSISAFGAAGTVS